jgi:hypothetical protein
MNNMMIILIYIFFFFVCFVLGLYVIVIGTGLSYGMLWSVLPILISELFGTYNFAMNFGWIGKQ